MTRNGRNDIREALVKLTPPVSLTELGDAIGVTRQRVGQCIDDPNPQRGRKVKRVVARKLGKRIDQLWPWPAEESAA